MTGNRTRLIILHSLSDKKLWSASALAAAASCSTRTIWRAISDLRRDGYPILSGNGKGAGYMMKRPASKLLDAAVDDYDNPGFWKEDHHPEGADA